MGSAPDVEPLHVRVMGVLVRLDAPDEATRARLAHQWSRALAGADEGTPTATIQVTSSPPGREGPNDYALTTRITLAALKATRGHRVNLHAGGVADDDDRVLALVGPSGTGKTTATRLLATRLSYLSDETVSVDPLGNVSPHPKPLSVVVDPERPFDKRQVSPDDIGLLATPTTGHLTRLVLLDRGDGPGGLSRMGTAEGLLALIEQTSSLARLPRPLHTLHALAQACDGIWRLRYQEFGDHIDDVVGLLEDEPERADPDPHVVWHPGDGAFPLVEGPGHLLARLPWVEAVEVGDDVVVLTEGRAGLLNGLVATVWLDLAGPRTRDQLVRSAQAHHGDHPDAGELVDRAIASLQELSLVASGSLA